MPATNLGGQLNLIMFELGMITRDPFGVIPDIVQTVAVHPLVVVPSSIRYTDNTRSTAQETHDGSIVTKAGRALRMGTLVGTFGVESRGLGPYIGTGDLRLKRFYHEIVRLSDAISKDQVNAEKDPFRSPLLSLALIPYDPDRTTFFINYYDFWHNIEFEGLATSFNFGKTFRGGGATGLTNYTLSLKEVGPIVTGGLGTTLINGLFQALTAWDSLNEIVKSYTLDAIAQSHVDAAGIVTNQFYDSLNALNAQFDGATSLLNGGVQVTTVPSRTAGLFDSGGSTWANSPSGGGGTSITPPSPGIQPISDNETNASSGLSQFLANANNLATNALALHDGIRDSNARVTGTGTGTVDSPGGAVAWDMLEGEGTVKPLDLADVLDGLQTLAAAATSQQSTGALYGMDRDEFAAFLSSTGASGRSPTIASTITFTVGPTDTAASIEQQFGTNFDAILELNQLLPDEALLVGTQLLIPRAQFVGTTSTIRGLPTFGSHAGREAWGADLYLDMRVNSSGGLQLISGSEAIEQGVDWIIRQYGEEILKLANDSPPVIQDVLIQKRVAAILATDRRIANVDRVVTAHNAAGGLDIAAELTAINGGTIQTGASA